MNRLCRLYGYLTDSMNTHFNKSFKPTSLCEKYEYCPLLNKRRTIEKVENIF